MRCSDAITLVTKLAVRARSMLKRWQSGAVRWNDKSQSAGLRLHVCVRRFTFKLSPGQEDEAGLQLQSFFTLGPKEGIFVTPVLRTEE